MADVFVLEVLLYDTPIGTLTRVEGDRTLFAFNEDYIADSQRPVLGLNFKDSLGQLITEFRPYQTAVMPFFSNLLPEGHLRTYLAARGGVSEKSEFFLLWLLGADLPGALTIRPADGEALPPLADSEEDRHDDDDERRAKALRFSLAGVQLKFSAVSEATGGLSIPAKGVGGSWIVKLPSEKFAGVPENEYSMLTLARLLGMDVPAIELVDINDIENLPDGIEGLKGQRALAIERFDRLSDGTAVHIEDFAQVFGLYPDQKYAKASLMNIAAVIAAESNEVDIAEFVRRLTFNTLIGNADMHVKNWSLTYPDRRTARLAPAYDFVSTIAYIPDDKAGLRFSRTKRFDGFTADELSHLAARARLPETLVLDTARETIALFYENWARQKNDLPLPKDVITAVEAHAKKLPIF
ncbi:MAG TPA: HipA domain-containing protein [Gammaproteobacteria bacterium]|nr:HipA domain-containing protein [Gammaproteobacteria bacterium]